MNTRGKLALSSDSHVIVHSAHVECNEGALHRMAT